MLLPAVLVPIYCFRLPELLQLALLFGVLPVLAGSYDSYDRLLVVWPIHIALTRMLRDPRPTGLRRALLFSSMLLHAMFIVMHVLDYWVTRHHHLIAVVETAPVLWPKS